MSDYFDRIEGHLLDAVERHANSRRARRRALPRLAGRVSRPWSLRASTVLAAMLAVGSLAVAGVFLASVHPGTRSVSGTLPAGRACGAAGARQLSRGSPPKSLLSILGVLRRSQTPKDRLPPRFARGLLRHVPPPLPTRHQRGVRPRALEMQGSVYEYAKYVRRARVFAHGDDYLIPLAAVSDVAGSSRCRHPYFAGVALFKLRDGVGLGGCCFDESEILAGHAGGTSSAGGQSFLTSLVPDRVASVTVYFKPGVGARTTITTKPVGNVVSVILPVSSLRDPFRVRSVWHSASGQIIKPTR